MASQSFLMMTLGFVVLQILASTFIYYFLVDYFKGKKPSIGRCLGEVVLVLILSFIVNFIVSIPLVILFTSIGEINPLVFSLVSTAVAWLIYFALFSVIAFRRHHLSLNQQIAIVVAIIVVNFVLGFIQMFIMTPTDMFEGLLGPDYMEDQAVVEQIEEALNADQPSQ